jgi:2-keto-4-pentenoate hydratase/2-oxohepta-3-ene-1,7-dioic acid hydratase in catechol pathway
VKFAHLSLSSDPTRTARLAVVDGDHATFLDEILDDAPSDLQQLIERGDAELARIREYISRVDPEDGPHVAELAHHPAVLRPPAIVAVGLNYAAHASELSLKTQQDPTIFAFWPSSLAAHDATTTWSSRMSEQVDYEAELGVIIGKPARDVSQAEALEYVYGYTVVNDITARNVQFSEAQWIRCKSFDGFTPVGPVVITADEVPDPQDLRLGAIVDGEVRQDASTSEMIHSVAKLISFLSESTTLLPGTLISTGSPAGAGFSRKPQVFLRNHSTVTVWVEGIGNLTTHCRVQEATEDQS